MRLKKICFGKNSSTLNLQNIEYFPSKSKASKSEGENNTFCSPELKIRPGLKLFGHSQNFMKF